MSSVKPPVVLVGAGLSFGLVPTANAYAVEIGARKSDVESRLGVSSSETPVDAPSLYKWAGDCVNQLIARGGSEDEAKMALAGAMEIGQDPRFLAKANIPLRGTTARHRVLCRLAREGRVESFWSFNWDCWLESSLEAVGLRSGDRTSNLYEAPPHWKLRYLVWFTGAATSRQKDTLQVFKAHGCVRAIFDGKGEFVVTDVEMKRQLADQPLQRIARMEREVSERWAVAVGWSATEGYVKELFDKLKGASMLDARLTIIDVNTKQAGHVEVCGSFGCDVADAGVEVQGGSPGTTDDLFLWIQTRRGLAALRESNEGDKPTQGKIDAVVMDLLVHDDENFSTSRLVSFMDSWLPIWLRTCFLVKAQAHRPATGNEFDILPTEQRDAHVPWAPLTDERHDLRAAAHLLLELAQSANFEKWDLELFPGALWSGATGVLVLPVPIWAEIDEISALSMSPLLDSVSWSGTGLIAEAKILALETPSRTVGATQVALRVNRWKESFAASFGHRFLAMPSNIGDVELDQLSTLL